MGQVMTGDLRAGEVEDFLHSLAGDWSYPSDTVDTFKAGGRDTPVTGIAVAWLPFTWALKQAIDLGCSLFITHEPTYYDHHDARADIFDFDVALERKALIEGAGMAVLRCHDLWDRQPAEGITDSWGSFLGLGEPVDGSEYARLYEIEPTNAHDFAGQVANRTTPLGQPQVHLVGDGSREVKRVCIGTGAISPYLDLVRRFDPDLVICSDDGMDYWRDGSYAVDGGPPLVVVHHGVTEEPGVADLAARLRAEFDQIPVHHIAQKCMYQVVPPTPPSAAGSVSELAGGDPATTGRKP